MKRFFTVKEASLILGYSTNTTYKLLNNGRIKAARGSAKQGRFRISKTALEDFLKAKLPDDPLAQFTLNVPNSTQVKKENYSQPNITPIQVDDAFNRPHLPLYFTRALILVGMILLLLDLFLSHNFSFLEQGLRLLIMTILIILTYQSGSLSSPTTNP